MKNKTKFGIAGVFALSAASIAMALSNVPASAVRAEGETETKIAGVVNNANFFGGNKAAMFTIESAPDFGAWYGGASASVTPAPTLVNPFGETVSTNGIFPYGNHIIFAYGNVNQYGNIVSFAKDAVISSSAAGNFKLTEGAAYICKVPNGESGDWTPFIEPNSVTVPEAKVSLGVAATYQVNASVDTTEENPLVFYRSSNTDVADVSASGVVTGKTTGTATISVYSGLKHAEIEVSVEEGAVYESFEIAGEPYSLNQGDDWRMGLKGKKGIKHFSNGSSVEVDITESMCDATGFDSEKLGSQKIKVTCDGKEAELSYNVVAIPEIKVNEKNFFGADKTGWGQFTFIAGDVEDRSQYLNLSKELVASVSEHILVNGQPMNLTGVKNLGGARYIFYTPVTFKQGDVVTIKAGFRLYQYTGTSNDNHDAKGDGYFTAVREVKSDFKYVATSASTFATWEADPVGFELAPHASEIFVNEQMKLDWTITSPEGMTAYGTPTFSSSDEAIATVDSNGLVVGKGIGEVTIKATLRCAEGEVEKSFTLNVLAEKTRTGIIFSDAWKVYSFMKGEDASSFAPTLTKAKFIYEDGSNSAEFPILDSDIVTVSAVDTSVVGEVDLPVTFKRGEMTLNGSIKVNVYEPIEEKVKQVAIVDWFDYSTFIQCGNTCANKANLTDSNYGKKFMEYISYNRADGTKVELSSVYQLGANIAIFPKFLYNESGQKIVNADNYNQLYQKGDIITIKEKTPLFTWTGNLEDPGNRNAPIEGTGTWVIEGYIEEELVYKYGDTGWVRFVETKELVAKADEITVTIGKPALANITRGPSGANSGVITYSSSDESIAKVNEKTGVIQGLKAGDATITATWVSDEGDKTLTKSITVHVVDALKSLKANATAEVNKGEDLDLSKLGLKAVYASGEEKDVDLSKVTVAGFDKNTAGAQKVTLAYTEGDVTVRATVNVTVKDASAPVSSETSQPSGGTSETPAPDQNKGGCGGEIIGTGIVAALALTGVAAIAIKRKKEDK